MNITIHNPSNLDTGPIAAAFLGDDYTSLRERQEVQLVGVNGEPLMFAEVLNVWSGQMALVPAMLLEMSNDPLQRTFSGLFMHLVARRATDETVVNQESVITVLVLRPKQSTLIRPTNNQIRKVIG